MMHGQKNVKCCKQSSWLLNVG